MEEFALTVKLCIILQVITKGEKMSTMSLGTAFQATDLQRNHRLVLDEARERPTLIRDKDGVMLQVGLADDIRRSDYLRKVMLDVIRLHLALALAVEYRSPSLYGSFGWASILPEEDQHKFLEELTDQIFISGDSGDSGDLEDLIEDWKVTALTWADESLRDVLTEDIETPPAGISL